MADKGYHAAQTIELADDMNVRTYIPEPESRYSRRWTDKPERLKQVVYNNRRRVRRSKSMQLQRRRSELCERSFAHVCNTGGMRRSWLRGLVDVGKRYLIAVAAHNLGRILRSLWGIGKPKALQRTGADENGAGENGDFTFFLYFIVTCLKTIVSPCYASNQGLRALRRTLRTTCAHAQPPAITA